MRTPLITAIGALALPLAACQSSPESNAAPEGSVQLTPLAGEVAIYRDDWGVPHIYADSEPAGFYALGYAQAEDALTLFLRFYLMVEGRLAATFGDKPVPPWTGTMSKADFDALAWRHMEFGERGIARLSPELRQNYESYVAGFKQYMAEHPEEVPEWAPDLTLTHLVGFSRAVLFDYFTLDGLLDCQAGGIKISRGPDPHAPLKNWGSNEWVVAPWRTADNATIVLSDPHGEVDGMGFYEFGMHAGALDVAGYAFGPLMLLTHNENVSWGMTTGGPDVSDCYALDVDPKKPERYKVDGQWKQISAREIVVPIKAGETIRRTAEYADINGAPALVVARDGNRAYAISTSYMDAAGIFDEEVYRMNLARNVSDMKRAAALLGMFPQNVMVGDRAGNLYYLRHGRTPRRPKGYDFTKPVPGNTSKTAWHGLYPMEQLVQVENPATGYMQNQNTPPDNMVAGMPLVRPEQYPPEIWNAPTFLKFFARARRSNEYLSRQYRMTVDEAKAFSVDEAWVYTDRWLEKLAEATRAQDAAIAVRDADFRRVLDALLAFDGVARKESQAALAYFYWRTALFEALSKDERATLEKAVAERTALPVSLAPKLVDSVAVTVTSLKTKHGRLDVAYGDVFRIGPSFERSVPVGGGVPLDQQNHYVCRALQLPAYTCAITMRAFIFGPPNEQNQRLATSGSRVLRLVSFTEPLQSFTLHNFGQTQRHDSPHYDDQVRKLSTDGLLKPTYFHDAELAGHIRSKKILKPALQ